MKLHTRMKRKLKLAHNLRHKKRKKKIRPKTFKTEASAKKYAEIMGIKNYEIVNLKLGNKKKLKIIPK
jgi:hypothetical protein